MIKVINEIKTKLRYLFNNMEWICAYRERSSNIVEEHGELSGFKTMITRKGTWAADPFLITREGKTYCFFEYMDIKRNKSALAMKQIDPKEEQEEHVIYEFSGHSSYPNIFEWEGKYYIIPETICDHSIVLLENEVWPYTWKQVAVLASNISAADCTPMVLNNRLCLMIYEELKEKILISIADLDVYAGKLNNTILSKEYIEKKARPGGHFIYQNGNIIAVRQPEVHYYGERLDFVNLIFNSRGEIEEEKLLNSIIPEQVDVHVSGRKIGIHTYNSTDSFEIVDILVQKFSLLKPVKYLLHRLRVFGYGEYERDRKFLWL